MVNYIQQLPSNNRSEGSCYTCRVTVMEILNLYALPILLCNLYLFTSYDRPRLSFAQILLSMLDTECMIPA